MKHKRDTKFVDEWTRRFKLTRSFTKFDLSTRKSQNFSFYWANFDQSIDSVS